MGEDLSEEVGQMREGALGSRDCMRPLSVWGESGRVAEFALLEEHLEEASVVMQREVKRDGR